MIKVSICKYSVNKIKYFNDFFLFKKVLICESL